MREIMFRGKRKYNGEWVYGHLIGNDVIVGDIVEFSDEYFNTEFWWKVYPETVGQYTGLKDKNGKEIYEGDVVISFKRPYDEVPTTNVVEFERGCWRLVSRGFASIPLYNYDESDLEIIGNIHDNPGMVEGRG